MSLLLIENIGSWWLTALAHFVWQGAAIWAITALAMRTLRHARASQRYLALCVALGLMTICVPITLGLLDPPDMNVTPASMSTATDGSASLATRFRASELPTVPVSVESSEPMPLGTNASTNQSVAGKAVATAFRPSDALAVEAQSGNTQPQSQDMSSGSKASTGRQWLIATMLLYTVCVFVLLCRLALGLTGAFNLRRSAVRVSDAGLLELITSCSDRLKLRWTPIVAWCERVAVPTVVGAVRPMILLPLSLSTGLNPEQLAALLTHELAHIRRYDHLVNLLQRLVEAILFFHPAVWCISRWMRAEREHCCDDLVVALGTSRVTYADSLLRVAELSRETPSPSLVAAGVSLSATGDRSQLAQRIVRLLCGPEQPPLRLSRSLVVVLLVLPWLLLLSPLWLQIQAEPLEVETTTATSSESVDVPEDVNPTAIAENAVPQVFYWSMLVDETLAERLVEADNEELPRQAAFRILRFDASKLHEVLFAADAQPHVLGDVRSVQALRVSKEPATDSIFQTHPSFHLQQGTSHGTLLGIYTAVPGAPFNRRFQHINFILHDYSVEPNVRYEIESQPFEFQAELPIGQAVAFTAQAESETGKRPFHVVFVFETLPRASDQHLRMMDDPLWFKSGHARMTAAIKQAERFNRIAAPMPDEFSERWTKTLPRGGSISLVGIARPRTHPFCWWDPDGRPHSTDWDIQRHAFGRVDVMALLCIRDPASKCIRQGRAYIPTDEAFRLQLTLPWKSLDDSELYLASVDWDSFGQQAQVGVNVAAGPWKEFGRLTPKKEIAIGKADYLLGEPQTVGDRVHVYLGRRYLADLDVRLRLLDHQGQNVPIQKATSDYMFHGSMTDTEAVPAGWPGHELFTAQIKQEDIAGYALDSRPRHSTTLLGFPTELAPGADGELPHLRQAQIKPGPQKMIADQLSAEIQRVSSEEPFEYFRDVERAAIVADFRQFVERHTPAGLSQDNRRMILQGASRLNSDLSVDYLSFFLHYRNLKWRVWLALNRSALSTEELARRDEQREELREFIRQIPGRNFAVPRTPGDAIDRLDAFLDDPWFGWFHAPLTDGEGAAMQKDRKRWNFRAPWTAPGTFSTIFQRVKRASIQDDPKFGTGTLPLDASIIAGLGPDLFPIHRRFVDQKSFTGVSDLVYDDFPKARRRILDFHRSLLEPPGEIQTGLESLREWSAKENLGVMAYDATRHVLVTLRDAKLAVLPVKHWADADRMSDSELHSIIQKQARDEIVLTEYFGTRPTQRGYGGGHTGRPLLGIESPEGHIGVIDISSVSMNGVSARLRPRPREGPMQAKIDAS